MSQLCHTSVPSGRPSSPKFSLQMGKTGCMYCWGMDEMMTVVHSNTDSCSAPQSLVWAEGKMNQQFYEFSFRMTTHLAFHFV